MRHGEKCDVVELEFDTSSAALVRIIEGGKSLVIARDSARVANEANLESLEGVVL
jgi:hypothetical protein